MAFAARCEDHTGRSHRKMEPKTKNMLARTLCSVFALVCVSGAMAGCGGSAGASPVGSTLASGRSVGDAHSSNTTPLRFFSPSSFWNKPVSADAPLDPASVAIMGAFAEGIAAQERADDGPWINTAEYSIPVYTVSEDQPTVRVTLDRTRAHVPGAATLSAAWGAVPLPSTAKPAVGTDGSLVIWQPSRDRLWEFHRLVHEPGGWSANWGGAMRHVSSNQGVYGPDAWPGAQTGWGMSASSLSLVGGLITLEDLELGQINHALEMALPQRSASVFASPAQRTDGRSTDPLALPEGAHLRLNPALDLAALHLPRLTLMLAEAAQRYGIFITDGTGASGASTFFAQDPTPTGTNPYAGPSGYFEGKRPNELLASFPWDQLQLLKMELHSVELIRLRRRRLQALRHRRHRQG
jgi:hypothetical protein